MKTFALVLCSLSFLFFPLNDVYAQSPDVSTGTLLKGIRDDAAALALSYGELQRVYLAGEKNMRLESQSPETNYQKYLRNLVRTELSDTNRPIFASANQLQIQSARLSRWWEAGQSDDSLKEQFTNEVQPAYLETLVTTYVYLECLRRAYIYPNAPQASTLQRGMNGRYQTHFWNHYSNLHHLTQDLMNKMEAIRSKAPFQAAEAPAWEGLYGNRFHRGQILHQNPTQTLSLERYFDVFHYPNLLPAEALQQSAGATTESNQTDDTAFQDSGKEPDYIADSGKIQRLLLRLQFLSGNADLSMNAEMQSLLSGLAAELQARNVASRAIQLANEMKTTELKDESLREKITELFQAIRPGKSNPLPESTLSKQWSWDAEKGLQGPEGAEEEDSTQEDAEDSVDTSNDRVA